MADMKIIIGADIKNLQSELAKAGGVTQNFANQTTAANAKVGASFATMGAASKTAATSISSVGSALGNVARGLLTGGIASGIALITGALLVMVKSFFEASEASKRLKAENEKITKTFLEAADAAGEEMGKVSLLTAVLESENATRLQKATALKELKKINYDYFGQLDIEDGKVKGLTNAYDGYIQRIIRSINAKASVDLLTDAYKEQAKALAQINQNIKAGEEKFTTSNLTEFQVQDAIRRFGLTFGAKKGESVIIDLNEKQLIADLLNAEAKIKAITSTIKDNIQDAFNPKPPKEVKVKVPKITVDKLPKLGSTSLLNQLITDEVPLSGITLQTGVIVKPKVKVEWPHFDEDQKKVFDRMYKMFDKDKLLEFQTAATDAINATISNIVYDSVGSMADTLGQAIAGNKDALPNLFGNIVQGIGRQLKELGRYLVQIGLMREGIDKAIKALNVSGVGAIAIGFAAQVLGSLLIASATKKTNQSGFASGTTGVSQGGFYEVGERGRERIFLPQGSKVQPNNEVQAFGGGNITLMPSISYDGPRFRIFLNQVDAQMSRNG